MLLLLLLLFLFFINMSITTNYFEGINFKFVLLVVFDFVHLHFRRKNKQNVYVYNEKWLAQVNAYFRTLLKIKDRVFWKNS